MVKLVPIQDSEQRSGPRLVPIGPGDGASSEDDGFSVIEMIGNIPSSAQAVGAGLYQAVRHPIDTGAALYDLGITGIAQSYIDKYGSVENALNQLEKDPVGTALDLSFFTGGSGAALKAASLGAKAAKAPAVAGGLAKFGKGLTTASRYTDPLLGAGKAAASTYRGVKNTLHGVAGSGSGVGAPTINAAAQAGADSSFWMPTKAAEKISEQVSKRAPKAAAAFQKAADTRLGRAISSATEEMRGRKSASDQYFGHRSGKSRATEIVDKYDEVYKARDTQLKNALDKATAPLLKQGGDADWGKILSEVQAKKADRAFAGGAPGAQTKFYDKVEELVKDYAQPGLPQSLIASSSKTPVKDWLSYSPKKLDKLVGEKQITSAEAEAILKERPRLKRQFSELSKQLDLSDDISVGDFVSKFQKERGSLRAVDALRKNLTERGMKFQGKKGKGRASRLAAQLNEAFGKTIDEQLRSKGLGGYKEALTEFAKGKTNLDEFGNVLGIGKKKGTKEGALRKILSQVRDTANFRGRVEIAQDIIDKVKGNVKGTEDLLAAVAGEQTRATFRPSTFSMLGAGGGALGGLAASLFTGDLIWGLAGASLLATHSPKLMGTAAFRAARAEAKIVKPIKAVSKLLETTQREFLRGRAPVTPRGLAVTGTQANRLQEEWYKNRKIAVRESLKAEAKKAGYNISPRVMDTLVSALMSDKAEDVAKGLGMLSGNKRLMELVEKAGSRGK